jgi:hypothetical protein
MYPPDFIVADYNLQREKSTFHLGIQLMAVSCLVNLHPGKPILHDCAIAMPCHMILHCIQRYMVPYFLTTSAT